jgi:predicted alpha/beta hydrolase
MKLYILLFFIGASILALFKKHDTFRSRRSRRHGSGSGTDDAENKNNDDSLAEVIFWVVLVLVLSFFLGYLESKLINSQS